MNDDAVPDCGYDALGVESVWVPSHFSNPTGERDGIVELARICALTERVRIGTAVVALPLYNPTIIAKQLADIDSLSNGRVQFGMGVGGEHAIEFRAAGVDIADRGARADESIGVLRKLWTGDRVSHHGKYFEFEDVQIRPRPIRAGGPPIIVAGRKSPAMRRAALLGDGWMPYLFSPERYGRSVEEIKQRAFSVERDLATFEWYAFLLVCLDKDRDRAWRLMAEHLGSSFGKDVNAVIERIAVAGTPDDVAQRLQAFIDAGARNLIFGLNGPDQRGQLGQILEEIVPNIGVKT